MSGSVKRKRMDKTNNRFAMFAITVVIIIFAAFMFLRVNALKKKEAQYLEKEAALLAQVAEQEERAERLEEYRVYVQTDKYIEKVAKEKLGLVNPDEIVIKPND